MFQGHGSIWNNSSTREEKISGQWLGVAKSSGLRALVGSEELVSRDWVTPVQ